MNYRREIDGLRAVAVVPVILFHAGFTVFSGGYVGVDVFFVISGYLITNIIITELEQGKFSILRFYERRARRILPALFFVVLCCIPFAWMWMPPSQIKDFSQSIVAVSLFASNILFWRESGYFAPAAEEKPLLHTWSLAVEEQYYVFFPIVLILLWRFGRSPVFYSIVAISIVSFLLSEWGWQNAPSAKFYLAPTRAWELLAGSICAFLQFGKPQRSNNALSALGLALILFSIFYYDDSTPFPSAYALAPVAGTALIILYGAHTTLVARLLSLRIFVGIGVISYSAYLWHQPLFAFARIRSIYVLEQWLMLSLAITSLVLAYFSWRFVEQPFRGKSAKLFSASREFFNASALGCTALIAIGLFSDNSAVFGAFKTDLQMHYFSFLDYNHREQFREKSCMTTAYRDSFKYFDKSLCLKMEETNNYILMGDSHAAHLWEALNDKFESKNILQATATGCRPLINYDGPARCTDLVKYIIEQFIVENQVDGLILSARWLERDLKYILPTIDLIKKHVDFVVVIGPTVEYLKDVPLILGAQPNKNTADLRKTGGTLLLHRPFNISQEMARLLASSSAEYVPIIPILCPDGACMLVSKSGEPMSYDRDHFTSSGAKTIIEMLVESGEMNLN